MTAAIEDATVDPLEASRRRMAAMLLFMGIAHVLVPEPFLKIIPKALGAPRFWNLLAAAAETTAGALLLSGDPERRRLGGWLALATIVGAVSGVADLVNEIAVSAREQSVGISEINTAVSQLDQVTQQNAAMVEESTAASHALRSEAETLAGFVQRFRTSDEAGPAANVAAAPRKKPVMAAAARHTAPKPAAAPVPRSRGSSMLAAKADEDLNDWAEF